MQVWKRNVITSIYILKESKTISLLHVTIFRLKQILVTDIMQEECFPVMQIFYIAV